MPQRLPAYLGAFDAVVLGDGSLQFARGLLEDLLSLPRSTDLQQQQHQQGGLGGLLKKGLWGKFLGGNGGDDVNTGGNTLASHAPSPPPVYPAHTSSYPPAYQGFPNPPAQTRPPHSQHQNSQEYNKEQNSKSYLHYGDF